MPTPTRKHTRARQGTRRANWKLKAPSMTTCPQCGQPHISHRACLACGFYRGRQVLVIKTKTKKDAGS